MTTGVWISRFFGECQLLRVEGDRLIVRTPAGLVLSVASSRRIQPRPQGEPTKGLSWRKKRHVE